MKHGMSPPQARTYPSKTPASTTQNKSNAILTSVQASEPICWPDIHSHVPILAKPTANRPPALHQ